MPCEFYLDEPEFSDLFLPFHEVAGSSNFLPILDKLRFQTEPKQSPSGEIQSKASDFQEELQDDFDFDAESIILDEEIEEGIDSIMGNAGPSVDTIAEPTCGLPKFLAKCELGQGMGSRIRPVRTWKRAEEMSYWWNFPTVDVLEISPRLSSAKNPSAQKKTATKKKTEKKAEKMKSLSELKLKTLESPKEEPTLHQKPGLMLKLDYDGVLGAWSGKGSPFSDEAQGSEAPATDVSVRL